MNIPDNDSETALILPAYIEKYMLKWRNLALSTHPINFDQAKTAVENAYAKIGKEKPLVVFFPSPFSAISVLIDLQLLEQFGCLLNTLNDLYFEPYFQEMFEVYFRKITYQDRIYIYHKHLWWESIRRQLNRFYRCQIYKKTTNNLQSDLALNKQILKITSKELFPLNCYGNYCSGKIELWSGAVDFCINVLACDDSRQWQLIESLIQSCGWIFPLDGLALICARPTKLSVDADDLLHDEKEPALQYADGYGFYSFHGQIVDREQLINLVALGKQGKFP